MTSPVLGPVLNLRGGRGITDAAKKEKEERKKQEHDRRSGPSVKFHVTVIGLCSITLFFDAACSLERVEMLADMQTTDNYLKQARSKNLF